MDDSLLSKIKNLPDDIKSHIIKYTYSPQPAELLEDIRDFHSSSKYINDYIIMDQFWIVGDIFAYITSIMYSTNFTHYYKFWRRLFLLQNFINDKIDHYVYFLETKPIQTQFNILWGLLTKDERFDVIYFQDEITDFSEHEEEDYDY